MTLDEIVKGALVIAKGVIDTTNFDDLCDVYYSSGTFSCEDGRHIFMDFFADFDYDGREEVWMCFSLEEDDRNEWTDSVAESASLDLTEESITQALYLLLKDHYKN